MSNTGFKQDLLRDIESYALGETPSAFEMLRAPKIENWSTQVLRVGKEFKLVARGQVHRHPEHHDGEDISTVAALWFDRHGRFVRTYHRLYALGEPAGDEIPINAVDL
ncbi:hypothetical protein M2171_002581 [Bradyrhizobium japonicum USDA 38]|uniref:hypothetical protein n=1 Tax=Bradyrhizobium japonicum TaxID=375 RepID=UPI00040F68ED|nr:hypothetical protein [Bradyrhizobium japonicum]MCS3893448.1 hypothetical protein [Bradyrhizobium japonicum USDA 38]MCS3945962.1 hypothetical protein [Bradyrhizobium japonicum]